MVTATAASSYLCAFFDKSIWREGIRGRRFVPDWLVVSSGLWLGLVVERIGAFCSRIRKNALRDALICFLPVGGRHDEFGSVHFGLCVRRCQDEPESLILAQSERWRHA
jgi:hypothetical protein